MSTFRWVFVEFFQICHSFNFANVRFVVKIIFFPIKFYKKIYFHGKFITEFCYSFFTITYVSLDEKIPFYRKQYSPSFNKTGELQVFALYFPKCLCLFMPSIRLLRGSVVKVLIMLLIKQ